MGLRKSFFPAKLKARISNTKPNKIRLQMQQEKLKCKQLKENNLCEKS